MDCRSLNGDWEFGVPQENQEVDYLFKMPVPGNWREQTPFKDYNGIGFYRYKLALAEEDLQKRLQKCRWQIVRIYFSSYEFLRNIIYYCTKIQKKALANYKI